MLLSIAARALALTVALLVVWGVPGRGWATHYPDGALCYDCHAVSASKMIAGTHLLKYDERAVALGMSSTSATVRCLFCHSEGFLTISSGQTRTEMKPVMEHFTSASLSKHSVKVESTFSPDAAAFDCLDCHSGITASVSSDGGMIHGVDASTQTLDTLGTLIGNPGSVDALCSNTSCHGGTNNSYGGMAAVEAHAMGAGIDGNRLGLYGIGLNDVQVVIDPNGSPGDEDDYVGVTACTDCHHFHNSTNREALLVLQNTATTEPVRLTECDVCHIQDENGAALDNFDQHGHGAFDVTCDMCHGVNHLFSGGPRLKAGLEEDTGSTSSVSSEYLNSNCLHCHEIHAPHVFAANGLHPAGQASCIDCHDQHGTTVSDGTNVNDTMIRLTVVGEPTRLDPGTKPESQSWADTGTPYDGGWYISGQTDGVCDNAACHATITTDLATDHGADSGGAASPADLAGCASSLGCHATHDSNQFARGVGCDSCHAQDNGRDHGAGGQNGAGENLLAHDRHTGNTAYYSTCAACHAHDGTTVAPGVGVHDDGTVNFGGAYMTSAFDYGPDGAADFAAVADSCGTAANLCHDGTGADWVADSLGTAPTSCQKCHDAGTTGVVDAGKILDTGGYPQTSGRHGEHYASNTYVPDPECDNCHGAGATSGTQLGHKNNAATLAQSLSTYNAPDGDCTNTCHDVTPTAAGDWIDLQALSCQNCHGSGLSAGPYGFPPAQGAHVAHTGNTFYVAANCVDCHNDNTTTHSTLDTTVTSPSDGLKISAPYPTAAGSGSCTNTCHLAGEAGDWTGGSAAVVCTDCHQGTYIGGGSNAPASGLHNAVAAGVTAHGATLGAGCQECHASTGAPPATHVDGTWEADAATQVQSRFLDRANLTYAEAAPNASTCAGTGLTAAAGCHSDNGNWSRQWSTAADSTLTAAGSARCDTCHGQFGNWREGTSHFGTAGGSASTRGQSHNELSGAANACEDCHAYPSLIANHENGFMTVNDPGSGIIESGGVAWCADCHSNDGLPATAGTHTYPVADFTLATVDGANDPVGNCTAAGCHNGTVSAFPPLTNAHPTHAGSGAGQYGYGCTTCHPQDHDGVTDDIAFTGVGATWAGATYTPVAMTCATLYCHGGATPDWDLATGGACGDCHGDVTGRPTAPLTGGSHQTSAHGVGCATCHDHDGTNTTLHVNGPANANGDAFVGAAGTGLTDYVYAGVTLNTDGDGYRYTAGTCTPSDATGCHSPGDWGAVGGCNFCHGTPPDGSGGYADNAHSTHYTAKGWVSDETTCTACHPDNTVTHSAKDGNTIVNAGLTPGGVSPAITCGTPGALGCHNNKVTPAWNTATPITCQQCHVAGGGDTADPTSGVHNLTATNTTSHDETIGAAGCQECHASAAAPPATHIDGTWEADGATQTESRFLDRTNLTYTETTPNSSTCSGTGLAACHTDGGTWSRLWSTAANADHRTTVAVTSPVCTVCHGTLNNWRAGMTVNHNLTNINNGTHTDCTQCHVQPDAPYGWATHHDVLSGSPLENRVEVNTNTDMGYNTTAGNCNNICHTNDAPHTMGVSSLFNHNGLTGPGAACDACHSYPPTSTDSPTLVGGLAIVDHLARDRAADGGSAMTDEQFRQQHGDCDVCHGVSDSSPAFNDVGAGFGTPVDNTGAGGDQYILSMHKDGAVQMNATSATGSGSTTDYQAANGGCLGNCHGGTVPEQWKITATYPTGNSITPIEIGSGCPGCHLDGSNGAPIVLSNAPHTDSDGVGGGGDVCTACHPFHSGGIEVPLPPAAWTDPSGRLTGADANMQTRLGITYTANNGIHLNATNPNPPNQTATSEAEVCWNCHDSVGVSEWGYNTKTTPAGFPVVQISTKTDGASETFNFGWIYNSSYSAKVSDWTIGYWRDQYYWGAATAGDPGLKREIVSVHAVNLNEPIGNQISSVGTKVDASGVIDWVPNTGVDMENKNQIRCSYCHDVHDTFGGAATDGKPYLRGTWIGNPYPADTPPSNPTARSGDGFSAYPMTGGPTKPHNNNAGNRFSTVQTAAMPRLYSGVVSRQKGGFFIDQNSNNPTANTAMDTTAETAGLCMLCHDRSAGSAVDTMDYYTSNSLWRTIQTNGHSNSTLGGTGASKVKIFDARRGGSGNPPPSMSMQTGMGSNQPWQGGQPWSNEFSNGTAGLATPNENAPIYVTGWYGDTAGRWPDGGAVTGYNDWYSATQVAKTNYHQFTCSKCHSPHATGLPALLVTNCLDENLSDWSAKTGVHKDALPAQNCHRNSSADNDGWHRLAPGQNR